MELDPKSLRDQHYLPSGVVSPHEGSRGEGDFKITASSFRRSLRIRFAAPIAFAAPLAHDAFGAKPGPLRSLRRGGVTSRGPASTVCAEVPEVVEQEFAVLSQCRRESSVT